MVFVHGLIGDAFETWRYGGNDATSWPHWLAEDFPEVAVWSLDYDASLTRWSRGIAEGMALPDRARQILDLIVQHGLGQRPLFFICHSLGGLVVKQLLRTASDALDQRWKDVFLNTHSVLYLGTPHAGARLATLADKFRLFVRPGVAVEDLQEHDPILRDLFNWYRNHAADAGIHTASYFELRALRGTLIVNPTSAHPGIGVDPIGLDEDHISISKPRTRDYQVFLAASEIIKNHVLMRSSNPRTLALTPRPPSARVPLELPPCAEEFVGREVELADLIARIRANKNTAIVGPAGMGKTALAARALSAVVGGNSRDLSDSPFPDGLVFLDLYTLRGAAEPAWETLANKLSGPDFMERRSARERATNSCYARNILVVVEGGEEADGRNGRATISEILSVLSPQNRWLLLTRLTTQAAVAESVVLKGALNSEDAAQLFNSLTRGRVPLALRGRALGLLEGHPLAITWAANLLARDDEAPERLLADWEKQQLPSLNDPINAEHTLLWLFDRSVVDLESGPSRALAASGLLSRAPFPIEAIAAVLDDPARDRAEDGRQALRTLVQRNLIERAPEDRWQFTHVLGYRFARQRTDPDPDLRVCLGQWLNQHLSNMLSGEISGIGQAHVADALEHAGALLRTDDKQSLWEPLLKPMLYHFANQLNAMGRLGYLTLLLNGAAAWFNALPPKIELQPSWIGERATLNLLEGDLLTIQGDLKGALLAYRRSLELRRDLAKSDPWNGRWLRDLSVSQVRVGDTLATQGDLTGALVAQKESRQVARRLVAADPSNATYRIDLSAIQERIGGLLTTQGDLAGALEVYRESLLIILTLARSDPSKKPWQRNLSVSYQKMGDLYKAQGDLTRALVAHNKSLQIIQRLTDFDMSNAGWQSDLSLSQQRVADILYARDDLAGALAKYKASAQIIQRLVEREPSNTGWLRDLGVSYIRLGDLLRAQRDLAGALAAYRESLQINRGLVGSDPSNASWRRNLAASLERVGDVRHAQGNIAEALAAYRESLQLNRQLAEFDPSNTTWQQHLGISLGKLGDVLIGQGDLEGALAAYDESLVLIRRLAERDPPKALDRRHLSIILRSKAELLEKQGKRHEALQLANESLQINEFLAALDPSNATWQEDVVISRAFVARLS